MTSKLAVLIFGATGMAGSGILDTCLVDPRVERVTVVVRKTSDRSDPKLKEVIHNDYLDYSNIEDKLSGHDTCFWCLGISQSQVRDEEAYNKITHNFTIEAAKVLSRLNKDMAFIFISGAGTNSKSRSMWARVKGATEDELASFDFKQNFNFRPAMIYTANKNKHSLWIYRLFAYLTPITRRVLPNQHISNRELGRAMINITLNGSNKRTLENIDIRKLL